MARAEVIGASDARPASHWPPLLLILVVAALLRVAALDKPLYIDEIVTITVANQPIDRMAAVMRQIDASPALYPLLLHGWMLVSHADAWVRLLSALCGWLAVVALFGLTARAFGRHVALAATAIMAISPGHVEYAQYVRSYSLFTLLVTLQIWAFVVWMDPRPDTRRSLVLIVLAALTTALLYTHYLSLLLLPVEGLFVLWRFQRAWSEVARWTLAMAIAGALFLPGVPLLLHNVRVDALRNVDRAAPPPVYRLVPNMISELSVGAQVLGFGESTTRRLTLGAAAVIFSSLWLAGAVVAWRRHRVMGLLLTAAAWAPLLFYVASGRRLVALRFFLPFMAGYLAMLGLGLASLPRRRAMLASVALVVVCAVPLWRFTTQYEWSYDHRHVAEAIASRWQPGDVLLFVHPYEAFYYRWYLGPTVPMIGMVFTALDDQPGYVIKPPPITFERARERVTQASATHRRLWVIGQSTRAFASDAREEARVLEWMDETYVKVDDLGALTGADPVVRLYAARGATP